MKAAKIIATFFGAGYMPVAPGTFGTIAGLLISYILSICISDVIIFYSILLLLIVGAYTLGIYACRRLEIEWGHDPSKIVIDEALGFWISILFLPININVMLAAFVLFRFFDIIKPFGIRKIDLLKTHHSVMLDDVVAGVYSNIIIQAVVYFYK